MVTVVDCSVFDKFFNTKDLASDKFEDIDQSDTRQIFHLLTQQIEFANVILLNKIDLVSSKDIDRIKRTIRQFNTKADIFETTNSKVDLT
jgi:G3E family GTPase